MDSPPDLAHDDDEPAQNSFLRSYVLSELVRPPPTELTILIFLTNLTNICDVDVLH